MKTLEREALVFMQLVIPQSFQSKKTRPPDLYRHDIEYETVQIWSEEWQCHISGLPHQWIGTL